ncbi:unnamed protein product [Lactuca virosa]|uniref:Uncharacterized protein n=1 Tax=Lactuca virosa TaxID=75947 RepID=A0AAU9MK28_9ASTR|nr:unnamed protein product [Lactuca virosa]
MLLQTVCRCHHPPPLKPQYCPFSNSLLLKPTSISHSTSTISINHFIFNLPPASKFKHQYGSLTILKPFRCRNPMCNSGENRHVDIFHEGDPSFHP